MLCMGLVRHVSNKITLKLTPEIPLAYTSAGKPNTLVIPTSVGVILIG